MAALTEEQTLLKEQARAWASEEAPVAKFREMRDSGNEYGFDKGTWASIGEMGWAGIVVPEAYGGVDMGYLTFGVVVEHNTRTGRFQILGLIGDGTITFTAAGTKPGDPVSGSFSGLFAQNPK